MAVGGFLDGQVVPSGLVHVVDPGLHVLVQVVLGFGQAVEHAVDEGHGLGTGDLLVGLKGTVLIALDPAVVGGDADLVLGPVAGDVGEGGGGLVTVGVEAGGDGGELGAADGVVGLKGAVLIALDNPHLAQGRHGAAEPVAVLHVVVAIALGHVGLAGLVGQQTEEDGGHLGAGNIVLGPHVVVAVANDISVVVLPVQAGRHIVGNLHNRRLGTVTTAATTTAGAVKVRSEGASLATLELLDHVLDGLIVQSSIGADLLIVLRPVGEVVSAAASCGCSGTVGCRHNLLITFSNGQDFHVRGNRTSVRIGADVLNQHLIAVGDTVASSCPDSK